MSDLALFIHSTGLGPFMWTKLLADGPAGLPTLTPTNRGYSMDDLLPRGTPFELAHEVSHLLSQVPEGTTGLHIGAHSYGGLVALELAKQSTLPVRSMWLYEPVLFASMHREVAQLTGESQQEVRAMFSPDATLMDAEQAGSDAWLAFFVDYWNHPGFWQTMSEKSKAMARALSWKMYQEVRCVSTQAQPFEAYKVDMPLTLVYGEHTRAPARDMVRRLAEVNPHAHVQRLDGLGHMSLVGQADLVKPALQAHWARVGLV